MSIKNLADKVISSDKAAFGKLFELLWEDIYIFAKSLLMDEDVAKDIVQDVWIDYWERREKIKNDDIKAYLFQATRFKIYNYFRDNKLVNVKYRGKDKEFKLFKDGELVHMLERHHIEGRPAELIAENLKDAYNEFC